MTDTAIVAPEAAPEALRQETAPAPEAAPPQDGAIENKPADQAGETEDQKDKPKRDFKERFNEVYSRMKNAERARDLALAEVERLRQPVVAPDQWDQLSFDQQQAAQMRQAVRDERASELEREAQYREMEAEAQRAAIWNDRVQQAKAIIPEIEAALSDPTLPVSKVGARFISESEQGPQVAYWLAQNRAEAARIARMEPMAQAFELGRIEARIASAPAARKLSTAPAPVPKVGGGANAGAKAPSSMSMAEYAEWYAKRAG